MDVLVWAVYSFFLQNTHFVVSGRSFAVRSRKHGGGT